MAFTDWKTEALRYFPELRFEIERSETPYILWLDLRDIFFDAYAREDYDLIRRIYEYSDWCIQQPQGETAAEDLTTCIAVCFYEHIPENEAARNDMHRWFSLSDLVTMQKTFAANLTSEEFDDLKRTFEGHGKS